MIYLPFKDSPFNLDKLGHISGKSFDVIIRDMIFEVLFTNPGERLNFPDFGCGLKDLIYVDREIVAKSTQIKNKIQKSLRRWMGHLIKVEQVELVFEEEQITIMISYIINSSGERKELSTGIERNPI